jgi:hypothetical protein
VIGTLVVGSSGHLIIGSSEPHIKIVVTSGPLHLAGIFVDGMDLMDGVDAKKMHRSFGFATLTSRMTEVEGIGLAEAATLFHAESHSLSAQCQDDRNERVFMEAEPYAFLDVILFQQMPERPV